MIHKGKKATSNSYYPAVTAHIQFSILRVVQKRGDFSHVRQSDEFLTALFPIRTDHFLLVVCLCDEFAYHSALTARQMSSRFCESLKNLSTVNEQSAPEIVRNNSFDFIYKY